MRRYCSIILCIVMTLCLVCSGCRKDNGNENANDLFVIGFSQVGSESDWRIANTRSMMETFTNDKGYELIIQNAKQQQDNQLADVRGFVLEGVDLIIIAPTVETGWENVLKEVHDAGIPVIILDRSVAVWDSNLYLTNIGSDFLEQGRRAVDWLDKQVSESVDGQETLKILHLQGTYGSTAQLMRTKALEEGVEEHKDWVIVSQLDGDFTEAKGYEVVSEYLSSNNDFDVLYSENDNMTFGAMRALDEAGITYGENGQVRIITFDASRDALQYCLDGKIDLCVECNPMSGPMVEELIMDYRAGEDIPRQVYVEEAIFTKDDLTQAMIDARPY